MARVAPIFLHSLQEFDHEVSNCWEIQGDAPSVVRVYTNPEYSGIYQDLAPGTRSYKWTELPSGTWLSFSVSCVYQDPEEEFVASFTARTTSTKSRPGIWRQPRRDDLAPNGRPPSDQWIKR